MFAHESDAWKELQLKICYLDGQYRQDDRSFLRVLNDIRQNTVTEMTVEYLSERLNKEIAGYAKATKLFTHNVDVDAINLSHLQNLSGEAQEYNMSWRGSFALVETLKKSCLAPEKLILKVGAQVMFIKNNYDFGYVNGTLGEVIGFNEEKAPIVRTFTGSEIVVGLESWEIKEDGHELAAITQLPLRLAWAITVHKSQGMSLDAAEIDLSRSFVLGMGYVALSRVRNLAGLKLMGMSQMALQVNPEVLKMDEEFHYLSDESMKSLLDLKKEKKEHLQKKFLQFLQSE